MQIERASDAYVTYWISITNLTAVPVNIEARYAVLGWSGSARQPHEEVIMRITIDTNDDGAALAPAAATIHPPIAAESSALDGGAAAASLPRPAAAADEVEAGSEHAAVAAGIDGGAVPDWLLQAIGEQTA